MEIRVEDHGSASHQGVGPDGDGLGAGHYGGTESGTCLDFDARSGSQGSQTAAPSFRHRVRHSRTAKRNPVAQNDRRPPLPLDARPPDHYQAPSHSDTTQAQVKAPDRRKACQPRPLDDCQSLVHALVHTSYSRRKLLVAILTRNQWQVAAVPAPSSHRLRLLWPMNFMSGFLREVLMSVRIHRRRPQHRGDLHEVRARARDQVDDHGCRGWWPVAHTEIRRGVFNPRRPRREAVAGRPPSCAAPCGSSRIRRRPAPGPVDRRRRCVRVWRRIGASPRPGRRPPGRFHLPAAP